MKRISKNELLAMLAAAGVSSTSAVMATNLEQPKDVNSLGKMEHSGSTFLADEKNVARVLAGKMKRVRRQLQKSM